MENTSKIYRFEKLTASNVQLLLPLYKKIFNQSYSLPQITQKYLSKHTGIAAQGYFAFHNDKPIAFHGAIPVLMEHKNEIQLAAQYGDAMTLKKHTGNGLFTKLGELTDDLLRKKEVRFVWGFPNQNSEYGYVNKLNWKGNNRMNCYIIPVSKTSSEQLLRKSGILTNRKQKQIKEKLAPQIQPKFLENSISSDSKIGTLRNSDYYNYKSFSSNYVVLISNTLVWIKTEGGLLIGDIEKPGDSSYEMIMNGLMKLAKQLGLHQLIFQVTPNTNLDAYLKQKNNGIHSWLIGYKNFNSDWDLNNLELTYGDLDTF
jgi:hypothetical protein